MRAALIGAAASAIVATPLGVTQQGWHLHFAWNTAAAKDGNNGHGGGNGGGNGHGGVNGNGRDNGHGKGKGGANRSESAASRTRTVNPATGDRFTSGRGGIEVVHRNGMREEIKGGRYLMKDNKGRTIIERAATKADLRRIRDLEG